MLSGPLFPLQNALPALCRFPVLPPEGCFWGQKRPSWRTCPDPPPWSTMGQGRETGHVGPKTTRKHRFGPLWVGSLGSVRVILGAEEGPGPPRGRKGLPTDMAGPTPRVDPEVRDVKHARMGRELSGHTVLDMGGVGLLGRSGWSWSGSGGLGGGGGGGRTPQKRSLCRKKFRPKKSQFRKCKIDQPLD